MTVIQGEASIAGFYRSILARIEGFYNYRVQGKTVKHVVMSLMTTFTTIASSKDVESYCALATHVRNN